MVQRKQDTAKRGTTNRHDIDKQGSAKRNIPNRNNNNNNSRRGPIKPQPGSKLPVKKQQKKVPEVPRVQYDKNGRRIRPKVTKPPSPPKEETLPPSNIIAEESGINLSFFVNIMFSVRGRSHIMMLLPKGRGGFQMMTIDDKGKGVVKF